MSRWSSYFRRAATLLLGVQLLQVILLAASAACDPAVLTGVVQVADLGGHLPAVAPVHAPVSTPVHHHGEHGAPVVAPADSPDGPATPPASAPPHHDPQATCPMAMACTVTAVIADVPTIATRTITVSALALSHDPEAPASVRPAPETPPPRA